MAAKKTTATAKADVKPVVVHLFDLNAYDCYGQQMEVGAKLEKIKNTEVVTFLNPEYNYSDDETFGTLSISTLRNLLAEIDKVKA